MDISSYADVLQMVLFVFLVVGIAAVTGHSLHKYFATTQTLKSTQKSLQAYH